MSSTVSLNPLVDFKSLDITAKSSGSTRTFLDMDSIHSNPERSNFINDDEFEHFAGSKIS